MDSVKLQIMVAGILRAGVALPFLTLLAGCGKAPPFDLAQVSGRVTHDNGSLVRADRLRLVFHPQGLSAEGKDAPRTASAEVNVTDGTFSGVTTWKYNDGAIVGHHRVVVLAQEVGPAGVGELTDTVPLRYSDPKTTPLEVEVERGSNNHFELSIDKTR